MTLTDTFDPAATGVAAPSPAVKARKKRQAPFSLRLSPDERARLVAEAAGTPLGAYIRAKVLGEAVPVRMRRSGISIADRRVLAQLVAMLGRSRLFSNLNQLAHAANIGALPATPETAAELSASLADLREVRRLLLVSLGLKPEGGR